MSSSAFLITRFPLESAWGGEEAVHLIMAEYFQKSGMRPVFCGSCSVMASAFEKNGFWSIRIPFFKDITSKISLLFSPLTIPLFFLMGIGYLSALRMKGVTKMLCMTFLDKVVWTPIALCLGLEVFWGHHAPLGKWFFKNPFLFLWKWWSRWVTIIVPSEYMKKALVEGIGEKSSLHITVIYNPLPQKEEKSSPQKFALPELEGKIILGSASRITAEKGMEELFEAFEILEKESPNTYALCIAGEGELKKKLEEKGLKSVVFLGFLSPEEMEIFWKTIDIFLLPSRQELFGMVLLEAMNREIPIIASNTGGIPEVIENTGVLVTPRSSKELSTAIQSLSKNADEQELLKKRGKKRVEEKFSLLTFQKKISEEILHTKNTHCLGSEKR